MNKVNLEINKDSKFLIEGQPLGLGWIEKIEFSEQAANGSVKIVVTIQINHCQKGTTPCEPS